MIIRITLAMITVLASSLRAADVDNRVPQNMQLFLLIGQSNMAGRGKVKPQDQVTHPRIFMLNENQKWVLARDPVHFDKKEAGVGLCSEFARVLAGKDEAITIGLIPCAVGGTPLNAWMPSDKPNDLYNIAVVRTREAMKSGRLAGILWHQGESDAREPASVDTYVKRFSTMIAQLRKDLHADSVPVLVGELGWFWKDTPEKSFHGEFNEATIHKIPDAVPLCVWVSAKDCKTDGLHFTAPALRVLGRNYADAYLALKNKSEVSIRQVARYHEERAKGRDVPIVGISDAHGCETGKLFGWYYTIIFAVGCEFDDIVGAIRGLRSVAVEALPLPDATPRAHGPYRLTCYAQFLMREFFPGHDGLCRKEGELMQAHARGDKHAAPELALLRGQTAAYMAKCFDSFVTGAE